MVLAIFLSLDAWRLARHKVLARRGAVIETLGAATRLYVDKTGTLTENRMQVAVLWRESAGGGVRLGRRIFANLRKALTFVTAIHVPIAGLALLPILFGLPPVFFPMHVVLLELVVDPVCSVVFEAEPSERGVMDKPPRPAAEPLFSSRQMALGALQGAIVLASVLGTYILALRQGMLESEARAIAFTMLVAANLSLAFADSAEVGAAFFDRHRIVFFAIAGAAALIVALILFMPPLVAVFRVSPPSWSALILALSVAVLAGSWFGIGRLLFTKRQITTSPNLARP
ncbi:MAG: cation transporting ATPase C-terminal domain-containing protein [Burkholderiales bacterium]